MCPHCQCNDQAKFSTIAANKKAEVRAGLRYCSACGKQLTVTKGTIFEDSHILLRKWLIAWYMLCSSKKGVSSLQLQRQLELGSYRTALFMTHRIRYALQDPMFTDNRDATVEVDETYVGGKQRSGRQGVSTNSDAGPCPWCNAAVRVFTGHAARDRCELETSRA